MAGKAGPFLSICARPAERLPERKDPPTPMRRYLALSALLLACCTPHPAAVRVESHDTRSTNHESSSPPIGMDLATAESVTEPVTTTTTMLPPVTEPPTTTTLPKPTTTAVRVPTTVSAPDPVSTVPPSSLAACIRHYESTDGVDPNLYQFEGGTWAAALAAAVAQGLVPASPGYPNASTAPRWVQDAAFQAWVNLGYLRSAWAAQAGRCF